MVAIDLKRELLKKSKREGEVKVRNMLVAAGLGLSTSSFLAKGEYRSEPKGRVSAIIKKVLAK